MREQMTTTVPAFGIAIIEPSTKVAPSAPPKNAQGGAFIKPRNPNPVPPSAPVAMTPARTRVPEKKETAALKTGEPTARRKRALTGPWIETQIPAATMDRTRSRRMAKNTHLSHAKSRLKGRNEWVLLTKCVIGPVQLF